MPNSTANTDLIAEFPEKISRDYQFHEAMEANDHDPVAVTAEVRNVVKQILSSFQGKIPDDKLALALKHFVDKHPQGEDLDLSMGSVGIGLSRHLTQSLKELIYAGMDPISVKIIEEASNKPIINHPKEEIDFRFKAISLVKGLSENERITALHHAGNMTDEVGDFLYNLDKVVRLGWKSAKDL